jgi:hypothetical protein
VHARSKVALTLLPVALSLEELLLPPCPSYYLTVPSNNSSAVEVGTVKPDSGFAPENTNKAGVVITWDPRLRLLSSWFIRLSLLSLALACAVMLPKVKMQSYISRSCFCHAPSCYALEYEPLTLPSAQVQFVISLFGGLLSALLALCLPALFYLRLFWKELGWMQRVMCALLSLMGLIMGIVSSVYTILGEGGTA